MYDTVKPGRWVRRLGWLVVSLLLAAGTQSVATAPARADSPSQSRWERFEDGSVSHGPDAGPITVAGIEVGQSFNPADYDGVQNGVDVEPDLSSGTRRVPGLPTVHALYVRPKGAPNRFSDFAAMFQQDLRSASDLLQTDFGRGIRLDERPSLTIGAPVLDITVVESSHTAAEFAAAVSVFSLVRSELQRRKFTNPDKKYIAWFDFADPRFCGQATLYTDPRRVPDNYNQLSSLAIIYSPGNRNNSSGGFCRAGTVLHELGHAFGAIQEGAPNEFDGAHCNDSENDIMCYPAISRWGADAPPLDEDPVGAAPIIARAALDEVTTSGPSNPGPANATFDFNRDDYWDPAADPAAGSSLRLPWWTVNLSRFLCSTEGCDKASNETGFTPVAVTRRGNQR